jgi:hypothetical protein
VDIPTKQLPVMIEGRNESVFLTRLTGTLYGEEQGPLLVTVRSRDGIRQQEFMETAKFSYAQQGIVHLRDGRWVSIGNRLLLMQTNRPPQPDEHLLATVLNAVKAGDRDLLSPALEKTTEYSPDQLFGLAQLLAKTPDPLANARSVEMNAREALRSIRAWQPAAGSSPLQQTQALAVLTAHKKNLQEFLSQIEEIRKGALGIAPELMANVIQSGYQYFGGWWVGPPRLLRQEDVDRALLDLVFLSETNTPRRGIFRLDAEGRLRLLGDYGSAAELGGATDYAFPSPLQFAVEKQNDVFHSPCQYVNSGGDEVLLFFPFQGLGRVAAGKFDWVDRSDVFKRMERVTGADSEGRIYLVSAPAMMAPWGTGGAFSSPNGASSVWKYSGRGTELWVYRRQSPTSASAISLLFPVVGLPVMDAKQRVWFLPLRSSSRVGWPEGVGALGDCAAAALARKTLKPLLNPEAPVNASRQPFFLGETTHPDWVTDLCCYEAGKVTVAVTNVPFETILALGNSNSILGYSSDPNQTGAFLLEQTGVTRGTNLHELAQKQTAGMLAAAPARAHPSSVFVPNYHFTTENEFPTIARTGDYLWVSHQRRLEVYRDGKPLGLPSRLTLLNCPTDLVVEGPLQTPLGPAMALLARKGKPSVAVFWAVPSTNDIDLVRGPERDIDPSVQVPLVNPANGLVYCPRFVTPPSFWVISAPDKIQENHNQGVPIWVTAQGDLLTRRATPLFEGCRLYSKSTERDIAISYTRKLSVIDELSDGTLLCRSPEGMLWLEPDKAGDYRVSRELALHTGGFVLSFLGETSRQLFLTVVDARQNAYLAVVDKPW